MSYVLEELFERTEDNILLYWQNTYDFTDAIIRYINDYHWNCELLSLGQGDVNYIKDCTCFHSKICIGYVNYGYLGYEGIDYLLHVI
jgi:hypothetical protein